MRSLDAVNLLRNDVVSGKDAGADSPRMNEAVAHEEPSQADGKSVLVRIVAGQSASSTAMAFRRVIPALILVRLTTDPVVIAGTSAAGAAGALVLGLWGSAFIDRIGRRRMSTLLPVMEGLLLVVLATTELLSSTTIVVMYVYALFVAGISTLRESSVLALLQSGVPRQHLARAYALYRGTDHGVHVVGKPLASLIFAVTSAGSLVLGAVLHFAASFIFGSVHPKVDVEKERGPVLAALREAYGWLWGDRGYRALASYWIAMNAVAGTVLSMIALHAKEVLNVPDAVYGALAATLPLGGMLGVAAAPYALGRVRASMVLTGAAIAFSTTLAVLGIASNVVLAGVALCLSAFAVLLAQGVVFPLLQAGVDRALYGRVQTGFMVLAHVAASTGAVVGGVVARLVGLSEMWWVFALALAITGSLMSKPLRRLDETARSLR
jgi:hypothetical protein